MAALTFQLADTMGHDDVGRLAEVRDDTVGQAGYRSTPNGPV
jgi:hypothetical protein